MEFSSLFLEVCEDITRGGVLHEVEFSSLFLEVCEDITQGGVFFTLCGGMRRHNTRWSFLHSFVEVCEDITRGGIFFTLRGGFGRVFPSSPSLLTRTLG